MAKLQQRIQQQARRRAERQKQGLPTASPPSTRDLMRISATERDAFTNRHSLVLLAIESNILQCCLENEFDDAVVRAAIVSAVVGSSTNDENVGKLVAELERARVEEACSTGIWSEGLRRLPFADHRQRLQARRNLISLPRRRFYSKKF